MAMRTARGAVVPAPTVLAHNGRDILPDLVAVAATASLALLLLAGDAPVGQGAATFALGATGVLLVATVYRVVLRVQAARRVRALPSDLLAAVAERLRALRDEPSPAALDRLASALAVIGGVHAAAVTSAVSLAQVGRAVVARTRPLAAARRVVVTLTVEDDAWLRACDLDEALEALVERAIRDSPPDGEVEVSLRRCRFEVRDRVAPGAGTRPPAIDLGVALARAVACRTGGDLHVFDRADVPGRIAVLELGHRAVAPSRTT